MKIHTLTLMATAAIAFCAATVVAQPAPAPKPSGDTDGAFVISGKFSEPTGEKIYQRVCAACHMPDAKGAQGAGFYPALAGNPKLIAGSYPVYVIVHGLNGMPPIGGMMTDQQVADVVNYVRTHFGNRYKDAVTATDVKSTR
jgi:mono/diheme cytochrome c family protein